MQITTDKIRRFLSENKWVILASVFFIVWKFFLIGILWQGRIAPPEPDDSYIYTGYINSVVQCPTFLCNYPYINFNSYEGFTYLSYRIIFGGIAKIAHLNPIQMFHISFYMGTILLLPILIFLLTKFTKNKSLIALSIFFLALFHGSGSYHGFYWVVPSFFATALFFLIFSLIFSKNYYRYIYLFILVPIYIFMHPISIYTIAIFPLFFIFYSICEKNINTAILKNVFFIIFVSLLTYIPFSIYESHAIIRNPLSIEQTLSTTTTTIQKEATGANQKKISQPTLSAQIFPGMDGIITSYIKWLFPHWIGMILFILFLSLIIYHKNVKLLSLYFSTLLFVFLSSLNEFGYRSLVLLWPITFIFYAFGTYYLFIFIDDKIKNRRLRALMFVLVSIGIFLFATLNIFYSIAINRNTNARNDIALNETFTTYLFNHTDKTSEISYSEKLLSSYSLNTQLLSRGYANTIPDATYYVQLKNTNPEIYESQDLSNFFNFFSKLLGASRTKPTNKTQEQNIPNFILEKTFNNISIYKNSKYL